MYLWAYFFISLILKNHDFRIFLTRKIVRKVFYMRGGYHMICFVILKGKILKKDKKNSTLRLKSWKMIKVSYGMAIFWGSITSIMHIPITSIDVLPGDSADNLQKIVIWLIYVAIWVLNSIAKIVPYDTSVRH